MAAVVDDGQFLDYKRRFQRFLTEDDDPMDAYVRFPPSCLSSFCSPNVVNVIILM